MPEQGMTVAELYQQFMFWCEEYRKPNTVAFYCGRLKPFIARFGDRRFSEITPSDLTKLFQDAGRWPDGTLKSNNTRRGNITAFQRLQTWAIKQKELAEPILERIEKPPAGRRERIPTPEELHAILDAGTPAFRLIVEALLRCGARPGELSGAQIADYDREGGAIVLADHKTSRKTGKPRIIDVGDKLANLLDKAIGDRTEGPIFLRPKEKPWTTQSLSSMFRRVRIRLGLPKDLCLYLTRHTFASKACERFGLMETAKLLGHTHTATTERYVKVERSRLRQIQDDIDPLAAV